MRGFTLAEVLVALGLVVMIYGLVSFTTLQIARYTRRSQEAASRKQRLIGASNQLRWQLRCLSAPTGAQALDGQRTDIEGRDRLRFLTSRPAKDRGVVEVAYEIQEVDDKPVLMYREFPYRFKDQLRPISDQQEAPWRPLSPVVHSLELEYSSDGKVWQKEWDDKEPPKAIRAALLADGDEIRFEVVPGVVAPRW